MGEQNVKTKKVGKWYFGGIASAGAASCTHPLDLLKVHLQTQQKAELRLVGMGVTVVRNHGFLALYNGLSASLLRQLTYSMTRFAIYDSVKNNLVPSGQPLAFYQKILLGGFAGCCGGFIGTPADLINVRMQNDVKLPIEKRRNYKHAIDGLYRVLREEGLVKLFSGASMASSRAIMVTIGQLSCYDQIKQMLMTYLPTVFKDNIYTHFASSLTAGGIATAITMPLDVMKTRMMNAKVGQYSGLLDCAKDIGRNGVFGFFKGFVPAFVRLGPQTVLTFIFLEQLRLRFGVDVPE